MGAISDITTTLTMYLKKSLIYLLVFIIFTFNLVALSISIQCTNGRYMTYRVASAFFAFLFGIIYIAFNYLQYRVNIEGNPCQLCGDDPFPF